MDGVKLVFGGVELTSVLSTYRVTYEQSVRKTVVSLDGTVYRGNVTRRPVIAFSLQPMTKEQARQYYDILKVPTASCTYIDPATNAERTARFYVDSDIEYDFTHIFDGTAYFRGGIQMTLRGVRCIA